MKRFLSILIFLVAFKANAVTVFYFEQQSNSVGVGLNTALDVTLQGNIPGCYFWNGTSFAPLNSTNCQYPVRTNTEHGAILSLCKNYFARTGDTVYAVMYSVAGVGLYNCSCMTNFYPSVRGGYFDKGVSTFNHAMGYLWNTKKIRSGYKFFFVPQGGETDAGDPTWSAAYETNLTNLISGWVKNINTYSFASAKKYVLIPLVSVHQNLTYYSTIQTACNNVATSGVAGIDGIKTLPQDGYNWPGGTNLHHDALGYKQEGAGLDSLINANNY